MNNSKKSLEIRNEVINLIKEKFEINFSYSYNDLYKIKDNNLVRRLKGNLYKQITIVITIAINHNCIISEQKSKYFEIIKNKDNNTYIRLLPKSFLYFELIRFKIEIKVGYTQIELSQIIPIREDQIYNLHTTMLLETRLLNTIHFNLI